jgi:hypothetical protein
MVIGTTASAITSAANAWWHSWVVSGMITFMAIGSVGLRMQSVNAATTQMLDAVLRRAAVRRGESILTSPGVLTVKDLPVT